MDLNHLAAPFTEMEIELAVNSLAHNKASGPDGLTMEFAQHFWPIIKPDVLGIFEKFQRHELDFTTLNRANISMIPKKEAV